MIIYGDCYEELSKIDSNSIDLVLIDPPYLISRTSNFDKNSIDKDLVLLNKYSRHSIDFGEWDKNTMNWEILMSEYYRVLKKGGTIIIFYDVWKLSEIKELADSIKFKQPRVGIWNKNNPVPINSKLNYLSNANEFFITFVKGSKPTFNSIYDNAIYRYPLCHGKERYNHPTQKPIDLIKDLISKHSNPGDLVLDTFAGTGTTGEACIILDRRYILIENNENYIDIINKRIGKYGN